MAPPFSISAVLSKGKSAARSSSSTALDLDLDAASDPTDWVGTELTFLQSLDSSLRCTLCYDIYTAPVVLRECHHTFCSVCIRSHINQPENKGRFCPQCRQTKAADGELVPAQGLEDAAEAWRLARPRLMESAEALRSLRAHGDGDSGSPSAHKSRSSEEVESLSATIPSASGTPRGVKRKIGDVPPAPASASSSSRQTRQSTAAARTASSPAQRAPPAPPSPVPSSSSGLRVTELKATDVTRCPICEQEYTLAKLNAHLDKGCDGSREGPSVEASPSATRSSWFVRPNGENSLFRNGGKAPFEGAVKLVRQHYVGKSDKDLKRMLEKERLPVSGSRDRMIARHRQWVNIFNANLDAAAEKRKTDTQLRRALSEWDRGKDEEERNRARGGLISEDRAKTWASDHKSEFAELVERARSSHRKNKDTSSAMPISGSQDVGRSTTAQARGGRAGEEIVLASEDDDDEGEVEWLPNPAEAGTRPSADPSAVSGVGVAVDDAFFAEPA